MLDKIQKFREYLDYVEQHYINVQKAWREIYSVCPNDRFRFMQDDYVHSLIAQDVKAHDASKLSAAEFTQYRRRFFPTDREEPNKALFAPAWEHHKENNAHHWQNWTKTQTKNPYADAYVIMMLVDWVAMSYEMGDTAEEYYDNNKDKMDLPLWADDLIRRVFTYLYPKTK